MNNEHYSLSAPMMKVIVVWLCAHDQIDIESTISLTTLVQCLTELGILRPPQRLVWRAIKKTKLQSSVPFREIPETVFCILLVCKTSSNWIDNAALWMARNHDLLVEKRALSVEAELFVKRLK